MTSKNDEVAVYFGYQLMESVALRAIEVDFCVWFFFVIGYTDLKLIDISNTFIC